MHHFRHDLVVRGDGKCPTPKTRRFGRVLSVQWEGEAGGEDVEHQKHATSGASSEGGAGGEVEITQDT